MVLPIKPYCIVLLLFWCFCRLRAHISSSSHSTSMAGALHRYIQTPSGGVLRFPRATERPRPSEWSIIPEHEISLSHGVHSYLLSSSPPLWIHWDSFPGWEEAKTSREGQSLACRDTQLKTCRNNEGLFINQFLQGLLQMYLCRRLSKTIHTQISSFTSHISWFLKQCFYISLHYAKHFVVVSMP